MWGQGLERAALGCQGTQSFCDYMACTQPQGRATTGTASTLKAAETAEGLTSGRGDVGRVGRELGPLARGGEGVMWGYREQAQKAEDRVRLRDPQCQTKLGGPLKAKRVKKHVTCSFVLFFIHSAMPPMRQTPS